MEDKEIDKKNIVVVLEFKNWIESVLDSLHSLGIPLSTKIYGGLMHFDTFMKMFFWENKLQQAMNAAVANR